MPYADNHGVKIHFETEGQGPPLVLQHGSLSSLEDWYDAGYVTALKNQYQLILIDARGHGASDKPHQPADYALDKRVADIVAVLDSLAIRKAHYYGYSMGGWIGFGIAQYAPARFHTLMIGGHHARAQRLEHIRSALMPAIEGGPEGFIAAWERDSGPLSPTERQRLLAWDYEAQFAAAQDRTSLEPVLPTMGMPCLLVVGANDGLLPLARASSRQMPQVTFAEMTGLDHLQCFARSDLVVPHMTSFLASHAQIV